MDRALEGSLSPHAQRKEVMRMSSVLLETAGVWTFGAKKFLIQESEVDSQGAPLNVRSKGLACKASYATSQPGPACLSLLVALRGISCLSSASTQSATALILRVGLFPELRVHLGNPSSVSLLGI